MPSAEWRIGDSKDGGITTDGLLHSNLMTRFGLAILMGLTLFSCSGGPAPPKLPTAPPGRPGPAVVQVEDDRLSRPQSGLQGADIVYEYLTEGGITRFSAIYMSPQGNQKIEPVRSARLVTLRVVKGYGGVLFYSGASDHVQNVIDTEHVPAINESTEGSRYFSRDRARQAPYNLVTSTDRLQAGVARLANRVTYELPPNGDPPAGGQPATSLSFQQTQVHHVAYSWSQADNAYTYTDEIGKLTDEDTAGAPVKIVNVVLVRVAHHDAGYTEDVLGENGIDFDFQGSGPAEVYTRGQHLSGTWQFDGSTPLKLLTADGKPFPLPKGLTWIHLVDPEMPIAG